MCIRDRNFLVKLCQFFIQANFTVPFALTAFFLLQTITAIFMIFDFSLKIAIGQISSLYESRPIALGSERNRAALPVLRHKKSPANKTRFFLHRILFVGLNTSFPVKLSAATVRLNRVSPRFRAKLSD